MTVGLALRANPRAPVVRARLRYLWRQRLSNPPGLPQPFVTVGSSGEFAGQRSVQIQVVLSVRRIVEEDPGSK
jgi:hypothetical protein